MEPFTKMTTVCGILFFFMNFVIYEKPYKVNIFASFYFE